MGGCRPGRGGGGLGPLPPRRGTSVSWVMTETPRGQVFSNVLANLLAPHPDIAASASPCSTAPTTPPPRYGSWNRTAVTPPSPLQDAVSAGPGT